MTKRALPHILTGVKGLVRESNAAPRGVRQEHVRRQRALTSGMVLTQMKATFRIVRCFVEAGLHHRRIGRWYLGNRARQLSRLLSWNLSDGSAPPPRTVTLKPTFLCNARCKMCSYANLREGDDEVLLTSKTEALPLALAKAMADELAPHRACVSISGGEPFLYAPLFELTDYLRLKGVMSVVTTNGTLIQRRFDELMAAPPDVLTVSVLGPAETHDRIIGLKGKRREIAESLRMVNEAKRRRGRKSPLIILNTPMLADNAHCFADVVDLGADLKVFANQFQHLWFRSEGLDQVTFLDHRPRCSKGNGALEDGPPLASAEMIWGEMEWARAKKAWGALVFYPHLSRKETLTYYESPSTLLKRKRAICAWLFTQIQPNGDVIACQGQVVGNLHEGSLLEIWNGDRMREFRRLLWEKGTLPICSRCCLYWRND